MSPVEVSEIAAWLYTVFMVLLSGKRNEDPNVLRMQMLEIVWAWLHHKYAWKESQKEGGKEALALFSVRLESPLFSFLITSAGWQGSFWKTIIKVCLW